MQIATLFASIGQWRVQVLWRLFGVVLFQTFLLQTQSFSHYSQFFGRPIGFQLLSACSFLLIVFGPRRITLLFTAAASMAYCLPVFFKDVAIQLSEEYILFIALSLMGALLTVVNFALKKDDLHIDRAHVSLFRIGAVTTMFFSGLAKFNFDFFNPIVSCMGLMNQVFRYWQIPPIELSSMVPPFVGALSEILIPVLLIFLPRFGLLYTFLLMGFIGHMGATPFALIIVVMACAFFCNKDGETMLNGLKKHWKGLSFSLIVFSIASRMFYIGHRWWLEFLVFQLIVIILIIAALYIMIVDRETNFKRAHLILPKRSISYVILLIFFSLTLVNGFSTYTGLKFRLGFAMLSNLRVDHVRWNHMFIPQWSLLRKYDHSILVESVTMSPEEERKMLQLNQYFKQAMIPGLIAPMSFKYRVGHLKKFNIKADLDIWYKGKSHSFKNAASNKVLHQWISELPDSKMFQEWLAAEGPQSCFH